MQVVEAVHQRQVLVATDHLMAVLAETAAVVEVIKRVVTRLFHQPLEPQTQAAAAVIAAQVGQVLSLFRTLAHNEHQVER
jgi:uncharacterized membrane protein YoaK (UPF0700 family)